MLYHAGWHFKKRLMSRTRRHVDQFYEGVTKDFIAAGREGDGGRKASDDDEESDEGGGAEAAWRRGMKKKLTKYKRVVQSSRLTTGGRVEGAVPEDWNLWSEDESLDEAASTEEEGDGGGETEGSSDDFEAPEDGKDASHAALYWKLERERERGSPKSSLQQERISLGLSRQLRKS